MLNRTKVMDILKITRQDLKFLEDELNLEKADGLKHKRFNKEEINKLKQIINEKYLLPTTAKQISESDDFADIDGEIYKKRRGASKLYIRAKQRENLGYKYCGINYNGKVITSRVHRIIAKTFIPTENLNLQINHIDGNKLNNNLSNLEWVTQSENMVHAHKNKLQVNAWGYEDSQSKPVNMFNLEGDIIGSFGSIIQASKSTGIAKNTIARHCKELVFPRKHKTYFRYQENI